MNSLLLPFPVCTSIRTYYHSSWGVSRWHMQRMTFLAFSTLFWACICVTGDLGLCFEERPILLVRIYSLLSCFSSPCLIYLHTQTASCGGWLEFESARVGLAWLDLIIFVFMDLGVLFWSSWPGKRKTWKSALAKPAAPLEFRKTLATFSLFSSCSHRSGVHPKGLLTTNITSTGERVRSSYEYVGLL
ncbi:hypothetical protein BJX68DRAFT_44647 [Aspergillus pseudodeflectus]|uniref:MARVEL domain-containing protein n=1 Tax=Aspergillus pseudodeflectus TaxID=176178 RepID=A0ABR4KMY5_9EURO